MCVQSDSHAALLQQREAKIRWLLEKKREVKEEKDQLLEKTRELREEKDQLRRRYAQMKGDHKKAMTAEVGMCSLVFLCVTVFLSCIMCVCDTEQTKFVHLSSFPPFSFLLSGLAQLHAERRGKVHL